MNENLKIKGRLHIKLFDKDGNLKEERKVHNTVVTAGLNFVADQLSTTPGGTKMTHMAVGTDATAVQATDTTLVAEVATTGRQTSTSTDSGAVLTFVANWAAGEATASLTEAGIFNAASAGTMLARAIISPTVVKAAGETMNISWQITLSV